MKKAKLLSILVPLMAMGLAGCGNGSPTIKDGTKYESDTSSHWTVGDDGTAGTKEKHTFVEDAAKSTPATCSAKGEKVEVCSVCGYEKKTSVSKAAHTYVEDTTASEASTCSKAGKKVEKCSACDDVKETALSKLDHTYVEDTSAKVNPTCSTEGKKVEKCSVCQDVKETALPKSAHTLGAGTQKTENGRTFSEYECSTCHNKVTSMIAFNTFTVEAGSFENGKISQDPVGRITWNVQLPAGEYDVYFEAKFSSSSGANRTFETRRVELTYNGTAVDYDKTKTAEDVGLDSSSYKAFTFCKITATGGVDKMTLENPNYRLVFDTAGYINFVPVSTAA